MEHVKELLSKPPVIYSVEPTDSVAMAATVMGSNNIGIVLVLEGERLVGVLSERDIIRRVILKGDDLMAVKIGDVMTKRVLFAREEDDPEMCLHKMEAEGCRHLPVISEGKPVGMVSIRDLMKHLLKEKEDRLKMLEDYVLST